MELRTGEPLRTGLGYAGVDIHRAARICSAAHGGQILLSDATRILVAEDRQMTSFVGREREVADIKHLLTDTTLLTLTGSGGCRETRLALQVATDFTDSHRDGVCLVELA